ncbi:hypothetical protein PILCRDRAFT_2484 [Piloderma croceum F 1598]|uniref:Uncharacterized protein n=1 Tax=Piloderma croceum (strain F 1598) TaxID=765440 RepID=A0A0C3CHG6_PILCF|nr:hypothetical protein PILCRDRAFT_2484 [Piloderma croceum F 1598]
MPKALRPSSIKLKQFSDDVLLVALAIRTAYLVDAIQVAENPDIPVFEDVTLWHDPSSSQTFFVNVSLLSKTYRDLQSSEPPWTAFIRLNEPPTLAPGNIVQVLADIVTQTFNNPISVISSQELTQDLMIPVAAILLEYPVAYVPTSGAGDQTAFLSRELLDVYECLLMNAGIGTHNRHTLMKFSCPNVIGVEHTELSPHRLIERMKERFVPRLQVVDSHTTLDIQVLAGKFDRVAL